MMTTVRRCLVATGSGGTLLALGLREAVRLRDADLDTARNRARQLGAMRMGAGLLLVLRPQVLAAFLGLAGGEPASSWLPRLVAVREVALGAGAVAASRPNADPWPWLMTIAAVDGAEAAVLAVGLKRGALDAAGGWAFVAADVGSASAVPPRAVGLSSLARKTSSGRQRG
jgi:hypothetical protein